MIATAVLAPVFVQIALTLGLLVWMGTLRIRALREGRLAIADIALGERKWPAAVAQVQNAYENQYELPLLFYVLIALALATGHATAVLVALAWLFVISRLAHAFVHTTSNDVPLRFAAYCVGLAVLAAMWVVFAIDVFAGADF